MASRQHYSGYNSGYRSGRGGRRRNWNDNHQKQYHWYHEGKQNDRYENSDQRSCSNQQPLHNRLENHSNNMHSEERHYKKRQDNKYDYYKTGDFSYRGSRKPYNRSLQGKFQEQNMYRRNSWIPYKERSRGKVNEEHYYSPVSDRSSPISSDDCQRTETLKKKQQQHYEKNTPEKLNEMSRKRTVEEMSETENLSPNTSFSAKCSTTKRLKTTNIREVSSEGHRDEDDIKDYKKKKTYPSSKKELEKRSEIDRHIKENNRSNLDDINTNKCFAEEEENVKIRSKYNSEDNAKKRNTNDYTKDSHEKDCRLENQGNENRALKFDGKVVVHDHVNVIQEKDKPRNCSEVEQVNFSVEDISSKVLTQSKDVSEVPAAHNAALCFDIKRSESVKTLGTVNKDNLDTRESKSKSSEIKENEELKEKTGIMNVLKNLETVKQKAPETHPIINTLVEYLTGSNECKRKEPKDTSVHEKSDEKEMKNDICKMDNKTMKSGQHETLIKNAVSIHSKSSLKKSELISKEVRKRRRSEPVMSNISDMSTQNEVLNKMHGKDSRQVHTTLKTCIIERSRHKSAVTTNSDKLTRTFMEKDESANENDFKSSNQQTFELCDDLSQSNETILKDNSDKVSHSSNRSFDNSKSSTNGKCSHKLEKMKKHSWGTLIPLGKEFSKCNAKQKIADTEKGKIAPRKTVNEITNLFETMNNEYSINTKNCVKMKEPLFNKNRDRVSHFNNLNDGNKNGFIGSESKGSLLTVSQSSSANSSLIKKTSKRLKNSQQPVMKSTVKNNTEKNKQNSQSENCDSFDKTTESAKTLTLVGKKVKVLNVSQTERKNHVHNEKIKVSLLKNPTVHERRKDFLRKDIQGEVKLNDSSEKSLKVKKVLKMEKAIKSHSERQSSEQGNKSKSKQKTNSVKPNKNRVQKEKEKNVSKTLSKYAGNEDSNSVECVQNKEVVINEAEKSDTSNSIDHQTKSNSASECYATTEREKKKSFGDSKSGVSHESEVKCGHDESKSEKRSKVTTDKNDFRLSLHNLMQCEAFVCLSDRKKESRKEGITSEERTDQSEIMDDGDESLDNKLVIDEDENHQKSPFNYKKEQNTTIHKSSPFGIINNSNTSSNDEPDPHKEIGICRENGGNVKSKGSDFENTASHLKTQIHIVENSNAEQGVSENIIDQISTENIEHPNTAMNVSSGDTISSGKSSSAKDRNTSLSSGVMNTVNKEQVISTTSIVQLRDISAEKGQEVDDAYAERHEIQNGCASDFDDDDDITPIELSSNFEIDVAKEKNVTTYPDDVIIMKRNITSQTMNSKRKPHFFSERIKVSDFDDDDMYKETPNGGTLLQTHQTLMKILPKDDGDSESSDGELSEAAPILTPSKMCKSKKSKKCKKDQKEKKTKEKCVPELPNSAENLTLEGIYKRGFVVQHVKSLKERGFEYTYALLNPLFLYQKEKSGKCLLCQSCNEYFTPLTYAVHHHVDGVLKLIDIDESMKNEYKVYDKAIGFWNEAVQNILGDLNVLFDNLKSRPGPCVPPKPEKVIAVRSSLDNVTIDESKSIEVSKKKMKGKETQKSPRTKSRGRNKTSKTNQNKQNKEEQKHVEERSLFPSASMSFDNVISHDMNNIPFSNEVVPSSSDLDSPASSQYLSKRFSDKFETASVNYADDSSDTTPTADTVSDAVFTSTPKPKSKFLRNSEVLPHNVQKSIMPVATSQDTIPGIGEPLPRGTPSSLSTDAINSTTILGNDEPMHSATDSYSHDAVAASQATIPDIELIGVSRETTSNSLSAIISQATIPGIGEPVPRGTTSNLLSIRDSGSAIVAEHSQSVISEEKIPRTRDYIEPVVGCAEQKTYFKRSSLVSKEENIHSKIMELCHLMDIKSPDAGLNMVMLSSKIQIMGLQKMNKKIVQHLKKPMK